MICENNLESEEIPEACNYLAYQVYFKAIDCCHEKGNIRDATEEAKEADNSIIDGDNISDQQKKEEVTRFKRSLYCRGGSSDKWQIHKGFCFAFKFNKDIEEHFESITKTLVGKNASQ